MAQKSSRKKLIWPHNGEGKVLIVGNQNLLNELLAYRLSEVMGIQCRLVPRPEEKGLTQERDHKRIALVLLDSMETRLDEIPNVLAAYALNRGPPVPLALYNLKPGTGCEALALSNGVRGFFYTHESLDSFLRGIRSVLDDQIWLPRGILVDAVLSQLTGGRLEAGKHDELTSREVAVLSHIGHGAGNEEIAKALGISRNTVRTHLHSVFRKLGLVNRSQAALWAAKHL